MSDQETLLELDSQKIKVICSNSKRQRTCLEMHFQLTIKLRQSIGHKIE